MDSVVSRRHFFSSSAAATATALWFSSQPSAAGAEALSRNVLLTGRETLPAAALTLRAGPVTAVFEPEIAFLRYVKLGDREILRGLYAAVRDKVWGTVAGRVSNIVHQARPDSFRLTFDMDHNEGDIDFGWQGVITGTAEGNVRFEFNGRARSRFQKNRLGFAVLHPLKECAGKRCVIEQSNGTKKDAMFPSDISPNQPFLDLRAISHEVAPGVMAEVRFEGEVFETEDHRNWTDANFKTYCTPLGLPFPVTVEKGSEVRQAVTISLKGAVPAARASASPEVRIATAQGAQPVKLPAIGLGWPSAPGTAALSAQELARVRALRPSHLRVDLKSPAQTLDDAARAGVPLEVALFLSRNAEVDLRAVAAQRLPAAVARWLVFMEGEKVTGEKWIRLAKQYCKGAPVAAGTNEYFTELNRERPAAGAMDLTCYSINPQVHAFDNQSLVENLEAQADTLKTARTFAGGKPIAVTPVTLRPRFNPQAGGAPEPVIPGRLPSRIDPRQMSLFGAAWTLGSIKYLSENGAASITYYETHGWGGVMETAAGAAMPQLFPSIPGAVFPLYHVLADVNEFGPAAQVTALTSSEPLRSCALLIRAGGRSRLLIANLTMNAVVATVDASLVGPRVRVRSLDQHSAETAMREPEKFRATPGALQEAAAGQYRLALLPYSVTRLDG